MHLIALPGQFHLLLTLTETALLILTQALVTPRATDAFHIIRGFLVRLCDRVPTAMALIVRALFQIVIYRHTVVEHKALAPPQALLFGHLRSKARRVGK